MGLYLWWHGPPPCQVWCRRGYSCSSLQGLSQYTGLSQQLSDIIQLSQQLSCCLRAVHKGGATLQISWTSKINQTSSVDHDFVVLDKCIIFWLNQGLRVYFDLYAADFSKNTFKYFFHLSSYFFTKVKKKYVKVVFKILPHTNQIIPSNINWAKIWCIFF